MANKKQPADHQQEHLDDPVMVPDFKKIPKMLDLMTQESNVGAAPVPFSDIRETICGIIDDSQDVEQYDGLLGVSKPFVAKHERPVGVLRWNQNLASIYDNPGTVAGARFCTGTMISNDLFLTAGHCFDQTGGGWQRPRVNGTTNLISPQEIATNMSVEFNYQFDPVGNARVPTSVAVLELKEYRLGGRDFAIVRLDGTPGSQFGIGKLAPSDASVGDEIAIISHPAGRPKRIEAGRVSAFQDFRIRYNDLDTLGGSSGAAIIRESDGCVVGIHTNGGCNAAMTGSNFGLKVSELRNASPIVQGLQAHTLPAVFDQLKTAPVGPGPGNFWNFGRFGHIKFPFQDRFTHIFGDVHKPVFSDIRGTPNKALDDRKLVALDKQFSDDITVDPGFGRFGGALGGGAQPFILSTPHHAAGVESGGAPSGDEVLGMLEQAIAELAGQLDAMTSEYEALANELGGGS